MSIQKAQVLEVLKNVEDPDLHRDIVSLGFIKKVAIDGGEVSVVVELTTPACPVKEQLRQQCVDQLAARARRLLRRCAGARTSEQACEQAQSESSLPKLLPRALHSSR